jgi:hypothetical protein
MDNADQCLPSPVMVVEVPAGGDFVPFPQGIFPRWAFRWVEVFPRTGIIEGNVIEPFYHCIFVLSEKFLVAAD